MKIAKEVKIGILVAAAFAILFTGFYFLKGANVFSNDNKYICYYPNIDGLQNSAAIQVNGITVGHVLNTKLELNKGVKVVILVDNSVPIPDGTVANLASSDLLGSKVIKLTLGTGSSMLPSGSELQTHIDGGLMDNVSAQLTPRLQELKTTISSLDNVLANINTVVGDENQKALAAVIKSLGVTANNLTKLSTALSNESSEISSIIHNTNSITGNLAHENDTVKAILAHVSGITRQLSNAPIQKTFTELQQTTAQLQGIMDKINNKQGSLGMLINDKELYNSLNGSLQSMKNLLNDLQAHPKKYLNLTVFGNKTTQQ